MEKIQIFTNPLDTVIYDKSHFVRANLMLQICSFIDSSGWTHKEIEQRFRFTPSCISALLSGQVMDFSMDNLINIAEALGRDVYVELR
jgi:predicted XRE-type DNA-binding protein